MLSSVEIINFKSLNKLKIEKLTPVTIIGGKNNTGKTTFIEAIFTLYDRRNPDLTLRQFAWRGVNSVSLTPQGVWGPFFYAYDLESELIIAAEDSERGLEKLVCRFERNTSGSLTSDPSKDLSLMTSTSSEPFQRFPETLELKYFINGQANGIANFYIGSPGLMRYKDLTPSSKEVTFVFSGHQRNPNEDATRFGILDIEGKADELLGYLRCIEPRLKSLSSVSHGDISLLHGDIEIGRKIPLSFMGEGTSRLATILLAILTTKNGIVLIDELENGLHYSVHTEIWRILNEVSIKTNCQIFATTHSYELVSSLSGLEEKESLSNFSYVRLELAEGKISPKYYTADMLTSATSKNWEIR